jgi:hypothetical protein
MHGGSTPRSKAAASQRATMADARAVLRAFDVEPLSDPIEALLRTAAEVVALKDWLGARFAEAEEREQFALAELFARGLDRASKLLVELHRLNLEERQARLDQRMALKLADALRGMFCDLGLDVNDREIAEVVGRHLRRVSTRREEPHDQ